MGKQRTNDHKVETTKEPKQQRVETLVRILIQRKNKHFDEKHPFQFERRRENQEEAIGCFKTIQPK